ncbi:NACHT, LRR and PYD domains-containing protein 12-like [Xyrauchen texanus]|uniref:NACHT, LRR and PYD domains-containing protein 12-like n=1 Tax=Xyrauchen texanus TaxID=154827 RepID=UPI00224273F9|nr:NACHT, LRR and PYD domains-containing protein 12-like [Xyrauchen texanus]
MSLMNEKDENDYHHSSSDREKNLKHDRSDSPAPSVLSMKSEGSMKMPIQFKGGDSSSDQRLKHDRSDSPAPSVLSMKSDRSMNMPIQFKGGDSSSDQSVQQEISYSSASSSLAHRSIKNAIPLKNGIPRLEKRHDLQATDEYHHKLKSYIKVKHQYIVEGLAKQGNPTLLNEIYTELYITEGGNGEISKEHEVKRIEKTLTAARLETPIKCNEIFKPLPGQDNPIRTVLTKGVAGIGKTISVQKFILDWAEGKANQDIHLIFPLPFRELNLMFDKKCSLADLLQIFFMDETSLALIENSSVVFIFDGLDECRLPLNFHSNETICDATKETSVDALLTNLMKGNLLPSALIWITSRPAAADLIPSECVDRVTEVRGFNEPQKEEYFRKRISDQSLANRIITHLKSSRSLYIMCHIPVFCWISATVLARMLSEAESREIPRTLTQMYTHFLIIQTNIKHEKDYEKKVKDEDMIFKLGKLAFEQLEKGNLIFYEEDLRECGIDVTEASVYSGLCTQIFREEFGLYHGKVYCFVHLSIQEHLAALYVHLSFHNSNKNVLDQGEDNSVTILSLHKCAVDKTLESKNGHLDLFLRFLMGLSVESNQTLLEGLLVKKASSPLEREGTIEYLKEKIKKHICSEMSLVLFHCLNELNDHSLTGEIQRYLTTETLRKPILPPELWQALGYILMTSDEKFDECDLHKYGRSDVALFWLIPMLKLSTIIRMHECSITMAGCAMICPGFSSISNLRELDLSHSNLQDPGVEMLCVGIKNSGYSVKLVIESILTNNSQNQESLHCTPDLRRQDEEIYSKFPMAGLQDTECRLESLKLKNVGVTEASCVFLSKALSLNPSHLRELDLSWNNIGDSGVTKLCVALKKCQCALETLRLNNCNLTQESCKELAEVLQTDSNLKELSLSKNELQDLGVNHLSAAVKHIKCKLEILRMSCCKIKTEGFASLTSALRSNISHLKELDLGNNRPGDPGVKLLSAALLDSNCTLKTLRIDKCGMTEESCASIASALSSKASSLTELDLSINDLQDSGVKLLCPGLKNPHCKLEKLRLSNCGVTKEGLAALAEAFKSNPSHLTELNLLENHLEESDIKLLSVIQNESSNKQKKQE